MEQPSNAKLEQWVETSRYRDRKDFDSLHGFFTVIERLGEGTFSEVFKAVRHQDKRLVAIKQLNRTTRAKQVYNESYLLQKLKGEENVAHLLGGHAGEGAHAHVQHTLVFPLYEHDDFRDLINNMEMEDVKRYMYSLCNALSNIHKHGIIHRDVKPSNFLFSKAKGAGYLIDFGLAHEWRPRNSSPCQDIGHLGELKNKVQVDENKNGQCGEHGKNVRSVGGNHGGNKGNAEGSERDNVDKVEELKIQDQHPDHGSETSPTSGKRSSTCPEERIPLHELLPLARQRLNFQKKGRNVQKSNNPEPAADEESKPEIQGETPKLSRGEPSLVKPGTPSRGPSAAGPRPLTSGRSRALPKAPHVGFDDNVNNLTKARPAASRRLPMKLPGQPHKSKRVGARTPDANRGGTPGFRAPEVLLRETKQGPGIDVWSAGVTFASLLAGRYPLFSGGQDDCGALLELCVLFGADRLEEVAISLRKKTTLPKLFTEYLGERGSTAPRQVGSDQKTRGLKETLLNLNSKGGRVLKNRDIPAHAFNLLEKLLEPNPARRISAVDALRHPFFDSVRNDCIENPKKISGGLVPCRPSCLVDTLARKAPAPKPVAGIINNLQGQQPCYTEAVGNTSTRNGGSFDKQCTVRKGRKVDDQDKNQGCLTVQSRSAHPAADEETTTPTGRLSEGHGEASHVASIAARLRDRRKSAPSTYAGQKRRCVERTCNVSAQQLDSSAIPRMLTRSQCKGGTATQSTHKQPGMKRQRIRYLR